MAPPPPPLKEEYKPRKIIIYHTNSTMHMPLLLLHSSCNCQKILETEASKIGKDGHKNNGAKLDNCFYCSCNKFCSLYSYTGNNNEEHYFMATQDKELRNSLGQILGGATLFLSVNGIHIAQPTEIQKGLAKQVSIKETGTDPMLIQDISRDWNMFW